MKINLTETQTITLKIKQMCRVISDTPVTKGRYLTLVLSDGEEIKKKCIKCEQINILYNPNGGLKVMLNDKLFYLKNSAGLHMSLDASLEMIHLARSCGYPGKTTFLAQFKENFNGFIITFDEYNQQ